MKTIFDRNMDLNTLTAISPIDGRYREQSRDLAKYFSEFGLIKCRIKVEVDYFIALCELPLLQLVGVDKILFEDLKDIYRKFNIDDAYRVKEIERSTNHDVKAVEYFLKERFDQIGLKAFKEFIHFGLTSQDINNTATPFLIKESIEEAFLPRLEEVMQLIAKFGQRTINQPMLARTHGQPASPTLFGKEFLVFYARLKEQLSILKQIPHAGKFGGATGNFNAHVAAFPEVDWNEFAKTFLENNLGLKRSYPTTQIEHYDYLATLFDALKRINTILIDFCRDVWQYISMNYIAQKINTREVGSSAMPHKVNPIDFENAEGNLGYANAIFEHLSSKLPVSRLQRDLTDSTVLRNVGMPIAHSYTALASIIKGMKKIQMNKTAINADLEDHWVVVSEGIQTILRREGYPKPYEALKKLTRINEQVTAETIRRFIDELNVLPAVKKELNALTPFNYTGIKYQFKEG